MSFVLIRPHGDDVAASHGPYFSEELVSTFASGEDIEVLCEDKMNYHAVIKDIDADGVSTVHFIHWSNNFDWKGNLQSLYITQLGRYSSKAGISQRNRYDTIVDLSIDKHAVSKSSSNFFSLLSKRKLDCNVDDDFDERSVWEDVDIQNENDSSENDLKDLTEWRSNSRHFSQKQSMIPPRSGLNGGNDFSDKQKGKGAGVEDSKIIPVRRLLLRKSEMAVARVDDQELVLLSSLPRSAWKGEPVKTLQESALGRVVNVIPDVSRDRALVRLSDGTTVKRVPKKLILLAHNSREAQELNAAEAGAGITHTKQPGKAVVGKRRVKAVPRQIVEGGGAQRGADPKESRNEGAATGEGGLIHCMDSTDGSILRTFADSQQAVEFWLDADATPATKRRVAGVLLYNSRMERTFYGFRWEQEQPPADALARTLEQSQARTLEQPQAHTQAHALAQAQPHAQHKGQSQSRTAGVSESCIECALVHLTVDYPRLAHLTNLSLSRAERSMYLMAPDCVLRDMQLHIAHHGNNRLKRLPRGLAVHCVRSCEAGAAYAFASIYDAAAAFGELLPASEIATVCHQEGTLGGYAWSFLPRSDAVRWPADGASKSGGDGGRNGRGGNGAVEKRSMGASASGSSARGGSGGEDSRMVVKCGPVQAFFPDGCLWRSFPTVAEAAALHSAQEPIAASEKGSLKATSALSQSQLQSSITSVRQGLIEGEIERAISGRANDKGVMSKLWGLLWRCTDPAMAPAIAPAIALAPIAASGAASASAELQSAGQSALATREFLVVYDDDDDEEREGKEENFHLSDSDDNADDGSDLEQPASKRRSVRHLKTGHENDGDENEELKDDDDDEEPEDDDDDDDNDDGKDDQDDEDDGDEDYGESTSKTQRKLSHKRNRAMRGAPLRGMAGPDLQRGAPSEGTAGPGWQRGAPSRGAARLGEGAVGPGWQRAFAQLESQLLQRLDTIERRQVLVLQAQDQILQHLQEASPQAPKRQQRTQPKQPSKQPKLFKQSSKQLKSTKPPHAQLQSNVKAQRQQKQQQQKQQQKQQQQQRYNSQQPQQAQGRSPGGALGSAPALQLMREASQQHAQGLHAAAAWRGQTVAGKSPRP